MDEWLLSLCKQKVISPENLSLSFSLVMRSLIALIDYLLLKKLKRTGDLQASGWGLF